MGTGRKTICPDLCGPLYDEIEAKVGGMAIFMNSAQGGMVTADNRLDAGKEANDWNECIRIGKLLADLSLQIISSAPVQTNPELYCGSKVVTFPVDNEAMRFVFQHSPLVSDALKKGDFSSIKTRVNLLDIGKAQVLTIPGEALPNVGFYMKRKMNTAQPMLFGLTNDAFGYMLTKEDFDSFDRYKYVTRTSLGENTVPVYEKEALQLVADSPAADK